MEVKALLKRLVETESPSTDKAAVDRVGAIVADEARRLGADVETVSVRDAGNSPVSSDAAEFKWRVVPANLGVNPSLTITALSEYIMDQMPAKTS